MKDMAGCRRRSAGSAVGIIMYIALLVYWPSWLGCHALQAAGGPVRIVRGRRNSSRVPTKGGSREGGNINKERTGSGRGGGGGPSSSSGRSTCRPPDRSSNAAGTSSNVGIGGTRGQRKPTHKKRRGSYSRGSISVMARMRRKVKDASDVPDLWIMLRDGLPYLTRSEATEVQLALAVSLYAHSESTSSSSSSGTHGQHDDRVKTGVEVCLQLGRLGMGRDALLAAILGGVLRPETLKKHSTHPGFGRAPVTVVDIREGFGKNVARLVAGLEHITCVEETAHEVLRGTSAPAPAAAAAAAAQTASGRTHGSRRASNVSGSITTATVESGVGVTQEEEEFEPLSPTMLIGVRERVPGEAGGRVRRVKARSLREATALEQAESLRNLIVSEVADWQVLTLRLAVQLQALKNSTPEPDGNTSNYKQLARDALLVHGPLAHRLGVHQLRNELETVAFRRLFPQQFNEVRRATTDRSVVYGNVVEATRATLKQALNDAPAFTSQLTGEVLIQHRIKSPYSMWKKMEKKKVSVEGVLDAVAVRVVLEARKWQGESSESYTQRSEDLCYQAMSVIQRLYPWSQSRLKDYVVKPKPNGYQSLHATQLVPDVTDLSRHGPSVAIEFQVRSKEMHQKAEFGHAAHWSYKESHSTASSLGWISGEKDTEISVPHTHKAPGKARVPDSVTSGPELVDWLHQELQERKVFVFGPDRKIWELDKGLATAGDVLGRSYMQRFYEGAVLHDRRRKGLGDEGQDSNRRTETAWVNGREVDASYLLKNGDVFDVQAASQDASKGARKRAPHVASRVASAPKPGNSKPKSNESSNKSPEKPQQHQMESAVNTSTQDK